LLGDTNEPKSGASEVLQVRPSEAPTNPFPDITPGEKRVMISCSIADDVSPNERFSRRAPTWCSRGSPATARDSFAVARDVHRTDRAAAKEQSG
jgi:hypothetical protein